MRNLRVCVPLVLHRSLLVDCGFGLTSFQELQRDCSPAGFANIGDVYLNFCHLQDFFRSFANDDMNLSRNQISRKYPQRLKLGVISPTFSLLAEKLGILSTQYIGPSVFFLHMLEV